MNLKDYSGPVERQREILSEVIASTTAYAPSLFLLSWWMVVGKKISCKLSGCSFQFICTLVAVLLLLLLDIQAVKRRSRLVDANEI